MFHEDRYREACEGSGGVLSECSVGDPEQRRLKLKHAWHVLCASTDDLRPLTVGTN